MLTIVTFIILISFLVLIHELGHFVIAKLSGVRVEEFGIGLPPRIFGVRRGETVYSINLLPIGGFVRLLGEDSSDVAMSDPRAFCNRPHLQQAGILTAGVFMNFILGVFLLTIVFARWGVPGIGAVLQIDEVLSNSPASEVNLEIGEEIEAFAVIGSEEFVKVDMEGNILSFFEENLGQEVELRVYSKAGESGASSRIVRVRLRDEVKEGEGILGIGFTMVPHVEYSQVGLFRAPVVAIAKTGEMMGTFLKSIGDLFGRFFRIQQVPEGVVGPVGIARITGQVVREGWDSLLYFVAILSISLAAFNILPLPALDGGRLVMVLGEFITGRSVKANVQQWVNIAGLVFLFLLMGWVTVWDVMKIF
ncbi:site-2 protease family protein [Patescibacteria group bacterium]|nr:site-2 protease family protein [Patescibacteria group bacterium]